ncbi:hypothetical protein RISK_004201 [Rhodopirellula islandica]|uniref:Uncharacterized protein n=1 Tax=Rhodopirellula islandica TaxID=595434 RepID=A0A0J1EE56_RHOIS|nr:hypothetical protein RISK_004201 [Rhodopirellula islandica]
MATKPISNRSRHMARRQRPTTQTFGDKCSTLIPDASDRSQRCQA